MTFNQLAVFTCYDDRVFVTSGRIHANETWNFSDELPNKLTLYHSCCCLSRFYSILQRQFHLFYTIWQSSEKNLLLNEFQNNRVNQPKEYINVDSFRWYHSYFFQSCKPCEDYIIEFLTNIRILFPESLIIAMSADSLEFSCDLENYTIDHLSFIGILTGFFTGLLISSQRTNERVEIFFIHTSSEFTKARLCNPEMVSFIRFLNKNNILRVLCSISSIIFERIYTPSERILAIRERSNSYFFKDSNINSFDKKSIFLRD